MTACTREENYSLHSRAAVEEPTGPSIHTMAGLYHKSRSCAHGKLYKPWTTCSSCPISVRLQKSIKPAQPWYLIFQCYVSISPEPYCTLRQHNLIKGDASESYTILRDESDDYNTSILLPNSIPPNWSGTLSTRRPAMYTHLAGHWCSWWQRHQSRTHAQVHGWKMFPTTTLRDLVHPSVMFEIRLLIRFRNGASLRWCLHNISPCCDVSDWIQSRFGEIYVDGCRSYRSEPAWQWIRSIYLCLSWRKKSTWHWLTLAHTTMSTHIYHGAWTNWSRGRISGATITLGERDGGLLTAFIATFVTIVGAELWKIVCFVSHQLRSNSEPQDGLYHQQQFILRNAPTPGGAVWSFFQQSWFWSGKARQSLFRTLSWAFFGIAYIGIIGVVGK